MDMNIQKSPETLRQNFVIDTAIPNDAAEIFNVQRQTWIDIYPNSDLGITVEDIRTRIEGINGELTSTKIARWHDTINSGERKVFVAKASNKLVGFVMPFFDANSNQNRIGAIYVLPEAQGKGIGRELLNQALNSIGNDKDIYLHVVSYNQNAINFYTQNGFIKTEKNITDGVAALTNGKHLPEIEMVRPADK